MAISEALTAQNVHFQILTGLPDIDHLILENSTFYSKTLRKTKIKNQSNRNQHRCQESVTSPGIQDYIFLRDNFNVTIVLNEVL